MKGQSSVTSHVPTAPNEEQLLPCRSVGCWIRVFVWDVAGSLYSRTHDRLLSVASLHPSHCCRRDVLVMKMYERCCLASNAQAVFDVKREPCRRFSHHAPSRLYLRSLCFLKLTSPLISKMSSAGSVESGKPPKVSHLHRHPNTIWVKITVQLKRVQIHNFRKNKNITFNFP